MIQLEPNIRKTIRRLQNDQITAMSVANLRMIVETRNLTVSVADFHRSFEMVARKVAGEMRFPIIEVAVSGLFWWSQMSHFDYTDLGYGVRLEQPDIDRENRAYQRTVFLQGDDAAQFLAEMEKLDDIWLEGGNPNPDIFDCQEDHIDLLIEPYFGDDT
jgi:hypothetical protein